MSLVLREASPPDLGVSSTFNVQSMKHRWLAAPQLEYQVRRFGDKLIHSRHLVATSRDRALGYHQLAFKERGRITT